MYLRHLLLILLVFCFGATSGGGDRSAHDSCELAFMQGTNNPSSRTDRCPSVSSPAQSGQNDVSTINGTTCNNTELPPFIDTAQRSCVFDGINNYILLADDAIEEPKGMGVWIFPTSSATGVIFTHGIQFRVLNCDTTKLQLSFLVGVKDIVSACDTVKVDEWNFVGWTWDHSDLTSPKLYTSGTANSNTLEDYTGQIAGVTYGDPAVEMDFGISAVGGDPFLGFMTRFTVLDVNIIESQMCLLCRAGVGNVHPGNGIVGWLYDAIDSCNVCTLTPNATHIGPRRIL